MIEKDLVIIGSGPAGYSAGIYAVRYNLKTLIIGMEKHGLIGEMEWIENYPGYRKISGKELMEKFKSHYEDLGGEYLKAFVEQVKKEGEFIIKTNEGEEIKAKAIIFATGTQRKKLGIKGEKELFGKGISYCATCDGPFTKGKKVFVIGGGNAALASAVLLKQYTEDVTIMHRRNEFRAMPFWVQKAKDANVKFILNETPKEFVGERKLEKIIVKDREYKTDFAFIEIGHEPESDLFVKLGGEITEHGFIKVNERMETNLKNVYGAGDCTSGRAGFAQVIAAASEGAIAARSAYENKR